MANDMFFGVGYIGEGKYSRKTHLKIYKVWHKMLQRCYDPYYINKFPTYIYTTVCEQWLNFQNFAKWYDENYYECNNERMELDKDILVKNNKIYSPSTCIFVPQRINYLFTKRQNCRGNYPIGVTYNKESKRLKVQCNIYKTGKASKEQLGRYPIDKPFQAFYVYKEFKENYIKQVADEYYSKGLIPKKLYDAMYKYEVEIND